MEAQPNETRICYGDSNTWGYDPVSRGRLDEKSRWTRVLGSTLGDGYEVIEEGLGGRTTVWDDPIEGYKNGKEYLVPCLESHQPLDLVIIMLGTNDLKKRFSVSAFDIAQGAQVLVRIAQRSECGLDNIAPQVLLLAPPPTTTLSESPRCLKEHRSGLKNLPCIMPKSPRETGCSFFDTSTVIVSSPLDGIHFEATEHHKLGKAVALEVQKILG